MTDSMKFGPEWLRNMSNDSNTTGATSTSSSSVTSLGPRYQLGEYRYGREEMLSLFDKNIKLPDILPTFKKLFVDKVQCPLALTPSTEEETGNTTRPWIMRSPVNYGTTPTRAISRGGSVDRGRGRTRGGFHTSLGYQRPAGLYEDEIRGTGRGERSWPERNGGNDIGTGDWNSSPSSSPRKEYGSHGRGSNIENWRRNRTDEEVGEGWRSGHRWSRSTSWRDEDSSENGKADGGGIPSISRSISMVKFSSLHERASSVLPSNLKGSTHNSSKGNSQWDQDDMLPEWAMENPTDIGGSFDASGAFHEPNERNDSKSPSSCSSSNKNTSQSDGGKNHVKHYIDDGNGPDDENISDEQGKNRNTPESLEEKKDFRTEEEHFADSSTEQLSKPPETKSELNRNEEVRLSKEGEIPGDESTDNNIRSKSNESSENESKDPEVLDQLPKVVSQQQCHEEQLQAIVSNHSQPPSQSIPPHQQEKSLPPMESVVSAHGVHPLPMQQQLQKSVPTQLHHHPPQMPPHGNPAIPKLVQPTPNLPPAPEPATDHMKEFADHMIEKLIMDDETSTMSGKSGNQVPKKNNLGVTVNSPTTSANMLPPPQTDAHSVSQTPHPSRAQDFWYYRDPQGNVQGPFPAAEMAEWYRLEYFDDNLFVRRACDSRYATLGELVDMCGSNMPFLSSHLIPPLVETSAFPAVPPIPHVTQSAQPTQHPPPPVNKQTNVNMVMGPNDAFASLNLQLQYLQKQYLLRQQTAIMTRLAASEPWSLLTPDQQQQMVNQKMTQVVLPDHLLSLSAFANYLSIVNPTYNVQQVAAAKNFYNPMKSPQPPMGNSIASFRNAHSEFSTTELHNLVAAASQAQAANPNLPSHMSPSVENEAIKALLMQLQMHKGIQPNMSPPTQTINPAKWSNIVQQHQQLQQQQQQQPSQPPMQQKPPQQQDKQKEQQMQQQKDIKQQEHHHSQQQAQMTTHQSQHGMPIRYHRHHQPGRPEKPPQSDQHLTHQEQPQHMQQQPPPARLSSTDISPPTCSPPPSPKPPTPPNLKQYRHVQEQQQQKQHQRQQELLQQQKQNTKQKQELQQSQQSTQIQIQNQTQQKQIKQRQQQPQGKLPEQQEPKQSQQSKLEQPKQSRLSQHRQQSSQQQKFDASEKSEYESEQIFKQEALKQPKLDQLDQSKEQQKALKQDPEQKSKIQELAKVKQVQQHEEHRKQKEEKRRQQASPQVHQQQNEQQKEKIQAQKIENDQQKKQLEEKKAYDQQKERDQQLKEQQRKQQEEAEMKLKVQQQQQDEQLREKKLHERFQEDQELLSEREKHEQLRLQKQHKEDLEEEQQKQRQQQFFMLLLQGNTELTQHMKIPSQEHQHHQKNEVQQQQQEQQRLQHQLENQFEHQQRELERFDQHDHYQLQQQQLQQQQKQQSKSINDEKLKSHKFEEESKKPTSGKGNKTEKKESVQQKKHTTTNDDEKKKDPTDERKRQKEEKRRQQLEEEKKRDEEERRKQEEQHRLQMEEKKRQEEIDQHRRMKLLENNGIRAAKLNYENGRVGTSVAPWSNTGGGSVPAPGPNFAEIQKAERERRAEEQRLEQLMEHQRKNQQLEMQVQKESTLKWNAQPLQPLTVKSLSEIQAEEHKRQLANEQAAALTADQTRRKDPIATMQTIAYPNNSINSIWNNRTNQSSAWNGKAWSTTSSSGFWEEPTKITFNNSNKQQAPATRSLSKSQTISNMQTVKNFNATNKNQLTAPQQPQPSQSHLSPSTATMYASGDSIRVNKVNYSDVYQTKNNINDAAALSSSNNANSNNDSKKDDDARSEFTSWCIKALSSMHSPVDVPTFISFLQDIESPYEVKDYIRMYLGETKDCNEFAKQFLERRSKYKNQQRAQNAHIDDMCSPAPAINPSSNDFQEVKAKLSRASLLGINQEINFKFNYSNEKRGGSMSFSQGKGKKIKKSKMTKLDARILGFSVTAAQDRLNVGDRDYGDAS